MNTWSLRARLTALAGLAVTLALGLAVFVAYAAVRHELSNEIDDQLRAQAAQLQQQVEFSAVGPLPVIHLRTQFGQTGGYVQVLRSDGTTAQAANQPVSLPVTPADLAVAAGASRGAIHSGEIDDTPVRIITSPLLPNVAVQVALPTTDMNRELHRLAFRFSLLGALAVGIAVVSVWFASRRALQPVAVLTDAAEQIATTHDLSHRIVEERDDEVGRLAQSFNTMLDALDSSNRAQQQLIADASHELRTPLASMRTNAEVLRQFDQLSPKQRAEVVDGLVGQVDELTGLVADVVELARGDAPIEEAADVALDELVDAAVIRARRHWPAVTFDVDLSPVTVRGVSTRLDRAVMNLLDNAAKFSGGTARVEVSLSPDGRLRVRDHGTGVAADALPHVFDRFYRADEARSMPGSGLGLAIVAQVARSHGGSVTLTNHPDGGAVAEMWISPVTP